MSKTSQRKRSCIAERQELYQQGYVDYKTNPYYFRWRTHTSLKAYKAGWNKAKAEAKIRELLRPQRDENEIFEYHGTVTGRNSFSKPNLCQSIPRSHLHNAFRTTP